MSAFEISLMIINEKIYQAGIIDKRTKEKIDQEMRNGLKNHQDKAIIYSDLVSCENTGGK